MKRLRSSDDLDSYNDKNAGKDTNSTRSSSSHRSFSYKSDNVRKNLISSSSTSSRYDRDRSAEEDNREGPRLSRKRTDHDFEIFDRRKGFDRYRDGYSGGDRMMHRSENFCVPRREFPKGFRSERDRSRREGSVSSWRRFGGVNKEVEESRGNRVGLEERGSVRSPKGLRDVKSPTWSRDSGSEQSRMRGLGDSKSKSKSKSRSPTWSKDSGSEQSKSVEVKKSEELPVDSKSSSEMEEGELEPELEPEPAAQAEPASESVRGVAADTEAQCHLELGTDHREVERRQIQNANPIGVEEETNKESPREENHVGKEDDSPREENHVGKETDLLTSCENNFVEGDSLDEIGTAGMSVGKTEDQCFKEEVSKDSVIKKSLDLQEECKQDKSINLEVKAEEINGSQSLKDITEENGRSEANAITEGLSQNYRDKGKSVAVPPKNVALPPKDVTDCAKDGVWTERESLKLLPCRDGDDDMEGPSTRGFELFSTSPVKKVEKSEQSGANKQKGDKLALEPLDLSLSLPNVLLPIGARDTNQAPGSPSNARSVQSLTNTFRTNSDGFTASMSFSGSQSFFHNPSCSLTQNSWDIYEQSVHSHPIFQAVDQISQGAWQGQPQNEPRHKEVPLYQRILMNGNGSVQQSQALQGLSNGQALHGQQLRVMEGSSKAHNGLEKQLSFHKQNEVRSPSQSVGSHDLGSSYSYEKKRVMKEKHGSSLYRSSSHKAPEQLLIGGADFVETVIGRIVSDPIHVMARKFHEMTGQSVACLKESIHEIMLNADKQVQLGAFQSALQNRSDITMETLLKSHRAQLEILAAFKTGLPEFLQVDNGISSSDLAEIFLNLRCRNLNCRSPLPVDECDCKVCTEKNGFCSACMCLICSKFDMASNTCSWVGCDVCLHWCHADCGLRESFIRNGCNAIGPQGTTEMQFHCVACGHRSEMFGFVKDVFQNVAKEWTAETFSKELEYIKRIFRSSRDVRGKRLHEIADQMLARLANKSELPEVYNYIMGFLAESDSSKLSNTSNVPGKEVKEQGRVNNGNAGPSQDTIWLKSLYSDKAPQLDRSSSMPHTLHGGDRHDKHHMESELERSSQKEPLFDELESIVRIKQAEAKMFQSRADDARREAEGLKRIAIAKNEKIEEEYMSRISKLRLVEVEELRQQKFEEFQTLERAHREYFNMKSRMEADIKDMLLKMEATKRNFAR